MLRIVVHDCDYGAFEHVPGAPVQMSVKTFDVEIPALETFLRAHEIARRQATNDRLTLAWIRQVVGIEILE